MLQGLKRKAVLWNRRRLHKRALTRVLPYALWYQRFDMLDAAAVLAMEQRLDSLPARPHVLWLVDGRRQSAAEAQALLDSLEAQLYPQWSAQIAVDAGAAAEWAAAVAGGARIGLVTDPTAQWPLDALQQDAGIGWAGVLDVHDRLRPHATLLLVEAALRRPEAWGVFADEDHIADDGARHDAHFKCQAHTELLLSHDCIGRPFLVTPAVLQQALPLVPHGPAAANGHAAPVGFDRGFNHHLNLACSEGRAAGQLVHVPHVLLHRNTDADDGTAVADAVRAHLQRCGTAATVEDASVPGFAGARVRFAVPQPPPSVTIVIPTRNGTVLLERCLRSLLLLTTYPAFNVVIVDNGSDAPQSLQLMDRYVQRDARVSVRRDDRPFNFAELNNAAVEASSADFVALINDDIEFITPDWLDEMVALAAQPGVGAVGARLWYSDGTLQHGGVVVGLGGGAGHALKRLRRDEPGVNGRGWRLQNYSAVTAACMVLRRAHWMAAGGMDGTRFAVAFNDVDFCLRLLAMGLRNVWTPHAEMFHHESVSRGRDHSGAKKQRFEREMAQLQAQHGEIMKNDPAYNANFTLKQENFALSDPARLSLTVPWFDALR